MPADCFGSPEDGASAALGISWPQAMVERLIAGQATWRA